MPVYLQILLLVAALIAIVVIFLYMGGLAVRKTCFKIIAESTSLPCILYNVPSRTVVNLSADTVIRLSQIKNIIGVKEASPAIARNRLPVYTSSSVCLYPGEPDSPRLSKRQAGGIILRALSGGGVPMRRMKAAILHAPYDIRVEEADPPEACRAMA